LASLSNAEVEKHYLTVEKFKPVTKGELCCPVYNAVINRALGHYSEDK